ncbi:hypothetical protein DFH08DRAFT_706533 [Mycena albidolilacea]|uniref:Uncharacterized protein n=1 Tax=Mycena albidolilacea TaxID=1033008 RepID=A0AAD6ZS79_9AGAR|nr:hypothetical protein DFH08DRAFT_706533 [Mycena albidolilacea]
METEAAEMETEAVEMEVSDEDDVDDPAAPSGTGKFTAAQQTALSTCFASMMELVKACATETGLTSARILRNFGKQFEETHPRRANPWNVYQRYAKHHLNRLNELRRAGAEEPLVDSEGDPRAFTPTEIRAAYYRFFQEYTPEKAWSILEKHSEYAAVEAVPTVGGRQRRFQTVFKKMTGSVCLLVFFPVKRALADCFVCCRQSSSSSGTISTSFICRSVRM